jgi:hypothetical protein
MGGKMPVLNLSRPIKSPPLKYDIKQIHIIIRIFEPGGQGGYMFEIHGLIFPFPI